MESKIIFRDYRKRNQNIRKQRLSRSLLANKHIYILLVPAFIYCIIFYYYPLFQGFKMSLVEYAFTGHNKFVGLKNYKEIITDLDFWRALKNTLIIGGGNLILGFVTQIILALLLNEVANKGFKKFTQTIIYTPNLFSWVAIGGIWISLLAPDTGFVNQILLALGIQPINFMTNETAIIPVFWFLNTWKTAGYGCVIFLAALTNINPSLYEAAKIDGANRWKQTFFITIPGLYGTMKVVLMLNLIAVLRMFSQSYILTNPMVIDKTEVAMTYTYKVGLLNFRMDYASAIAFVMLLITCFFSAVYQFFIKKAEKN